VSANALLIIVIVIACLVAVTQRPPGCASAQGTSGSAAQCWWRPALTDKARHDSRKAVGESVNFRAGWSVDLFCELVGVPRAFGRRSFGLRNWTDDKPISRHPGGVPILDCLAAHDAFKAVDLASLCNVLAAVINRAAFTGSMTRFGHVPKMRFGLSAFQ
jgi:hypothetical protein